MGGGQVMPIPLEGLYTDNLLGAGKVAEHNPINQISSFAAEEDDIKFGRATMEGTDNEKQVKIFAGASGVFAGVATYSTQASDLDNSQYKQYDSIGIMKQGEIMVYVEEAITKGDTVRIRHTASGSLVAGSFGTTADAGKTVVLTGAEYRSDAASGTVARLFLSPPFSTSADT